MGLARCTAVKLSLTHQRSRLHGCANLFKTNLAFFSSSSILLVSIRCKEFINMRVSSRPSHQLAVVISRGCERNVRAGNLASCWQYKMVHEGALHIMKITGKFDALSPLLSRHIRFHCICIGYIIRVEALKTTYFV